MIRGIQDELGPDPVVLWTAVVKERVGKIGHPFTVQAVPTDEEHSILKGQRLRQVLMMRGIKNEDVDGK